MSGEVVSCACESGFAPSGDGGLACTDVDECAAGACDILTTCVNTEGGFSCGACPPQYTGNGAEGCVAKPCDGDPGVDCPCVKVAPDGDDAGALASHGLSPFASVGAALEFAASNTHVATNVCVAGGAVCTTDPLVPPTRFPSPAGDELVMRDGISLYGSYESTGWTRCSGDTTELDPQGARGVYFGPEVLGRTRLDGFKLARGAFPTTAGVTIEGAQEVELERVSIVDGPELVAASDTERITGIDISGGAKATLTLVSPEILDSASLPHGHAPVQLGVHVKDSEVTLDDIDVYMYVDGALAYGVLFEDSPHSTLHGGLIRLRVTAPTPGASSADQVATGVGITGPGATTIDGTTVSLLAEAPFNASADMVGLALSGGADVVVSQGTVSVDVGTGVRAKDARVSVCQSMVSARGDHAYGAWLENSPGSVLCGGVSAAGRAAVGVHVTGDATATNIGSVGIYGAAGIELDDCGGAAPLISGSLSAPPNDVGTGDARAIVALGDCHPRVENSVIRLTMSMSAGSVSGNFEAIRCDAKNGVPSRCSVKNTDIGLHYASHPGLGVAEVAGVRCTGGSCAEVSSARVALDELSGCVRSCYRAGYGVVYGGSTLVSGVDLSLGCGGIADTTCWDARAPSLFVP